MAGMQIATQKYRMAKLDELTPHPENPRQGDVGAIHVSIEANGFYGAIVVQKSSQRILAGNHRYLAAQQSGAKTIPVVEVDVDDATALRILLADNRTNDLASYDDNALAGILTRIAADDIEGLVGTGYDGDDLDEMLKKLALDEAGVPDRGAALEGLDVAMDDPEHEVEKHDVWRLGRNVLVVADVNHEHRLYMPYLEEGSVFAPYPTPMLACIYDKQPLVLVQPNLYLAGHILDKYASRFGVDSISRQEAAA